MVENSTITMVDFVLAVYRIHIVGNFLLITICSCTSMKVDLMLTFIQLFITRMLVVE